MWVSTTPLNCSSICIINYHNHLQQQQRNWVRFRIRCSGPQTPTPRGFGSQDDPSVIKGKKGKDQKGIVLQQSKSASRQSSSMPGQAPGVSTRLDKNYNQSPSDLQFEERLQAVKRTAIEKKKAQEEKEFGVIDYDEPIESKKSTIGLGTQIGVGIAVVVFGLVFAFGDFLPSGSMKSSEDNGAVSKSLSKEETAELQSRLQQYEATLKLSPKDPVALEGATVTLAELGDYAKAATYLEDLTKEKPNDQDVFRLLGEIKYELKDYEASAAAYKSSMKASNKVDFEVLRGLTNALLAAKKPDEAVLVLLKSRERIQVENASNSISKTQSSTMANEAQNFDPVQIELLLGKAYSDWGHVSDAASVYDQLILSHPNDFRGYLAKGILLKQNGNVGDAERMFIQARFFAPEKVKALVDRYARN